MSPRTAKQFREIREGKKKLIMDTALSLFARNGFHATSISQIAQKAGISKGLLYNYFESKEELLSELFNTITEDIVNMLDPNRDNEITDEEAISFVDLYFESLKNNRNYWQLFYQLSVQPDVLDTITSNHSVELAQKNQELLHKFLIDRNMNNPVNFIVITSVLKGFSLQYVFAPEIFSEDELLSFKNFLKEYIQKTSKS